MRNFLRVAVATVLALGAACVDEAGFDSGDSSEGTSAERPTADVTVADDPDYGEIESRVVDFLGIEGAPDANTSGFVTMNCDPTESRLVLDAMDVYMQWALDAYPAFAGCVLGAPLVEFNCRDGLTPRNAVESIQHPNFVAVECMDLENALGSAYPRSEFDVAIWPYQPTGNRMKLDHSFLHGPSTNPADPAQKARDVAATIAHEVMHTKGFRHVEFPFGQQYYSNTIPEQVEECVRSGAAHPADGPRAWGICTSFDTGDRFAVGDVRGGDGVVELLVAEDDGGQISFYSLDGTIEGTISTSYDEGGDDIAVGDIDGDSVPEILVAEDNGGMDIYRPDGLRLYTAAAGSSCASNFDVGDGLAVGNVNGVGADEVMVAEDDGGLVQVFRPEIQGSTVCFRLETTVDTGYDVHDCLASHDTDGDGVAEILVGEDDGGLVTAYRIDGSVVRAIQTTFDRGDFPLPIGDGLAAIIDVDGDGLIEIAVAEDDGGKIDSH